MSATVCTEVFAVFHKDLTTVFQQLFVFSSSISVMNAPVERIVHQFVEKIQWKEVLTKTFRLLCEILLFCTMFARGPVCDEFLKTFLM